MRSYNQYCALASALDVVGDRWTLLVIRELMIRDKARYTDLKDGLPGIATNLLAERLRDLVTAGLVVKEVLPPPAAVTVFSLTERGRALESIIMQLGAWGAPRLLEKRRGRVVKGHWFVLPFRLYLQDHTPNKPPCIIVFRCDGTPITVRASAGKVEVTLGEARDPDLQVTGDSPTILRLLKGSVTLSGAKSAGVKFQGDTSAVARVAFARQGAAA